MYNLQLVGPQTRILVTTGRKEKFDQFVAWLREYNPAIVSGSYKDYPISSENRIVQCKVKARKLGLAARKLNLN